MFIYVLMKKLKMNLFPPPTESTFIFLSLNGLLSINANPLNTNKTIAGLIYFLSNCIIYSPFFQNISYEERFFLIYMLTIVHTEIIDNKRESAHNYLINMLENYTIFEQI